MATGKPKKTASAKKIVDVKPDGDGATGTSRPVIVTNRPILKDPMMAEISQLTGGLEVAEPKQAAASEPTSGKTKAEPKEVGGAPELAQDTSKKDEDSLQEKSEAIPASTPVQKKVITPPSETDKKSKEVAVDTIQPEEPTIAELAKAGPLSAKDSIAQDSEQSVASVDSADEVPTTDGESKKERDDDSQAVHQPSDAVRPGRSFDETNTSAVGAAKAAVEVEQIGVDEKGNAKKQVKKGGELTVEQKKAIEKEKYFLSITTAETRRMRREILFATLFVLVLIVIWLDIMLDAGLLSLGNLKAVTNFF